MPSDSQIVAHWRGRLTTRLDLVAAARQRHEWLHTAATKALLSKRKHQVAFAERVIDRHLARNPLPSVLVQAAALIAHFEGGMSADGMFHPYWDRYGRCWTVGYGHTEHVSAATRPLTRDQALRLLAADLKLKYAPPVLALKLPKPGMTVATISLVYNCGTGIIAPSTTIGHALHARNWNAAAAAFMLYDHAANGQILGGLQERRAAERRQFVR